MLVPFLMAFSAPMLTPPLPTEVLHEIGRAIISLPTLAALASASRRFNAIFTPILYSLDAQSTVSSAVAWAVEHGSANHLQRALAHGATVKTDSFVAGCHRGKPRLLYGLPSPYYFEHESPPHPLCVAVRHGYSEIVEILLDTGCCVNMVDHEGFSLLCLAVIHRHAALVRPLLNRGALQDDNAGVQPRPACIGHRNSAVQIAAWQGRRDIVETLLEFGSEETGPSTMQMQHAVQCAIQQGHKHIIPLLVEYGADLNFCFKLPPASSPLLWTVVEGDTQLTALLLGRGNADANYLIGGNSNDAPLYRAVLERDEAMVRLLAAPSSQLHRTRALGRSADADFADTQVAQILLEHGALPDFELAPGAPGPPPASPLVRAICAGRYDLVRLLVENGANANILVNSATIPCVSGWFVGGPLRLAGQLGHHEIAAFLRDEGAREDVGQEFWDELWPGIKQSV